MIGFVTLVLSVSVPWSHASMDTLGGDREVDLFSSTDELRKLFDTEKTLHAKLVEYATSTKGDKDSPKSVTLGEFLDKHYGDYDSTTATQDADEYVGNPVNTYAMLKRTGVHWPHVRKAILNETSEDETVKTLVKEVEAGLPTMQDIQGAAAGIFLLHETYNLDLKKFSEGILEVPGSGRVIKGHSKLVSMDLEMMGKLAFNRGFYDRATEWLEAAIWKATQIEKVADQETLDRLKSELKTMQQKHDQVLMQKGPRGPEWRTFRVPFDKELAKKKKFKKHKKNKRYQTPPAPKSTADLKVAHAAENDRLWDLFNAACRGDRDVRPAELDVGLSCYHLHYADPYLKLGPFKLEQKNHAPFVAVFHDFMSEAETTGYREAAASHLVRSRHYGKDFQHRNEASIKRTSSQTWLGENEGVAESYAKGAKAVTKRLELATRMYSLSYHGGETFQVANYGIGGVYNHHTDSSGELGRELTREDGITDASMMGDRVATAMGYLSDVAAGGATAFPLLGTAVWPKRGDVVFWYNNDRNGMLDKFTFHGGCPVLAGSKWITNKWIRSFAQFQLFPCLTSARGGIKRLKPLNNDICQMTENCDKAELFKPFGGSALMKAVVPLEDRKDFNQL